MMIVLRKNKEKSREIGTFYFLSISPIREVVYLILVCCLNIPTKAQNTAQRTFPINIIFKWVNENQTQTVETFSGGGPMYTFERLLNEKMTHIDSAVFWVNGVRESLGKQGLDEYSRGSFIVKEETDTLWFFAKKKKAVLYYYPGAYLGTPELYFIEKPAIMLRAGYGELPIRMRDREYVLYRNLGISMSNGEWANFVKSVSSTYKSAFSYSDDYSIHLSFYGKSNDHINAVLSALKKAPLIQHISIALDDVLYLRDTYFISSTVQVYTDKSVDTIRRVLSVHGFTMDTMVSDWSNSYSIRYVRDKILGSNYLKDLSAVLSALGAKSTSISLYSETRLD